MNKLLNPSVLLPLIGCVMGIAFASFGDTVAGVAAFCFPIATMALLRVSGN
nr:MAG TPA: Photosystem I reaction centre subunit VIII [Caudoviricetes sp.]